MSNILCISDLHEPYSHVDSYYFLKAINNKYKFSRIVNIGDEVDYSALSFHDSDPDLPSATKELELAQYNKLVIKDMYGEYYFCHNMNKDPVKSSMSIGYNFIQGHFHTDFRIGYWNSPEKLRWGMTIGCLIDKHSLAFAYSRVNIRRPTLGCAIILNGIPQLIPMTLEDNGRWNGKI